MAKEWKEGFTPLRLTSRNPTLSNKILSVLKQSRKGMNSKDVIMAIVKKYPKTDNLILFRNGAVNDKLVYLERQGKIKRIKRGVYKYARK